jgi:hypothetical protein
MVKINLNIQNYLPVFVIISQTGTTSAILPDIIVLVC